VFRTQTHSPSACALGASGVNSSTGMSIADLSPTQIERLRLITAPFFFFNGLQRCTETHIPSNCSALSNRLGGVRRSMLDRGSVGRRVEQPYAQCRHQHHTDDYHQQQSHDIGRAELSDAGHNNTIISKSKRMGLGQVGENECEVSAAVSRQFF
jgi:hypothetical protein